MIVRVGVKTSFDAAHHLHGYDGLCANVHGHTYHVEASVLVAWGPGLTPPGIILDLKTFKDTLRTITKALDHHDLNLILSETTAEYIAWYIASELQRLLKATPTVRVWETPDSYAEVVL